MKKRSDYFQTIKRSALILNTLGSQNKELVLSELSCLLGLHRSSVCPMLATSQDENFFTYNQTLQKFSKFLKTEWVP